MITTTRFSHCLVLPLEDRLPPAIFTVTSLLDSGAGSLRQSVLDANAAAGTDTIVFDAGVFNSAKTIALTTGHLLVTDALQIQGPIALLTIDAGKLSRHFQLTLVTPGDSVSISNLKLVNGNPGYANGGSINNFNGALFLSHMTISNNTTQREGGGICVTTASGSLSLLDSVVSNNTSTDIYSNGGGIDLRDNSVVTIGRSTISGNSAGQDGGGVYFFDGGNLTMFDSTVSGNKSNTAQADIGGGGIYLINTTATIRNCTISGNSTNSTGNNGDGGGIIALGSNGITTLLVQNSTIAFNSAGGRSGGGIYTAGGTANITLESVILFGNQAANGPDLRGEAVAKNCMLSTSPLTFLYPGSIGNLLDADPLLDSLGDNGGPTATHALMSNSPAIDMGVNPAGLANDQRGPSFPRVVGAKADIGAFERQLAVAPPTVVSVHINDGSTQRSRVTSITMTFSESVSLPADPASAFLLTRTGPNGPIGTVNLLAAVLNNTVTLSFLPDGTVGLDPGASLIDGVYSLTVIASSVTGAGGTLDGNGDGQSGDNFTSPTTGPGAIYRLFGDADGNGTVTAADFNAFRLTYGTIGPSIFDFDANNQVTAADFNQFRTRYGVSLLP